MTIILTDDQNKAMDTVVGLSHGPDLNVAVVTGYAGTGKTTMIRIIYDYFCPESDEDDDRYDDDDFRRPPKSVTILAPTGKAALRVSEATGIKARTIHSWLYTPVEDPVTGVMTYVPKHWELFAERQGAVVIIDEASMVSKKMWEDIVVIARAKELRLVILGDPFQLPPVQGKEDGYFNLLDLQTDCRVNMEQIVRQALDNPIIRASMHIREGETQKGLKLLTYVPAFDFQQMAMKTYEQHGVIICHTNQQRHDNNVMLRQLYGKADFFIEPKEPLLITRNNYDLARFNGEIVQFDCWIRVPTKKEMIVAYDRYAKKDALVTYGHARIEGQSAILSLEEVFGVTGLGIDVNAIDKSSGIYYANHVDKSYIQPPYLHANLGYSLTCHKSQGSEWKYVLIQPGKYMRFKSEEDRRWLYTAVTRAKEEVRYTDG